MKNHLQNLVVLAVMTAVLSACAIAPDPSSVSGKLPIAALLPTATQAASTQPQPTLTQIPGQELTLLRMAEEEQMARDIYNVLYLQTGQKVFQNIAASEQTHIDTLLALMMANRIDPLPGTPGQYSDPGLQALYNSLIADASQSTLKALQTGALVEETDIRDLRLAMAECTDPQTIEAYQQLLDGSYNHLAAFAGAIQRLGGQAYQAQLLPAEDVAAILAEDRNKGGGNGAGQNGTRNQP